MKEYRPSRAGITHANWVSWQKHPKHTPRSFSFGCGSSSGCAEAERRWQGLPQNGYACQSAVVRQVYVRTVTDAWCVTAGGGGQALLPMLSAGPSNDRTPETKNNPLLTFSPCKWPLILRLSPLVLVMFAVPAKFMQNVLLCPVYRSSGDQHFRNAGMTDHCPHENKSAQGT